MSGALVEWIEYLNAVRPTQLGQVSSNFAAAKISQVSETGKLSVMGIQLSLGRFKAVKRAPPFKCCCPGRHLGL